MTRPAATGVCCLLMLALGACSSGAPGSAGAEPSAASSQAATEPASIAPGDASAAAPADTTSPTLAKWDAFKARAVEFAKITPKISDLLRQWAAGDTTAAKQIGQTLKPASDDLVAWLDANPPHECYRASWEPLREGARLTSLGAGAYIADDPAAGSDNLMAGGSKIVEAGSTISDSGDRCRATG